MDETKHDEAVLELGEIKIGENIPPGEQNGDVESGNATAETHTTTTTTNETHTTMAATNDTKVPETAPKNGDGCPSSEVHMFDTENKKENGGPCRRSAKIFISIAIVIGVALTAVIVYYTVPGVRGGTAEINNEKGKINAEQISGDEDGVTSPGVTSKSSDTDPNTNMISSTSIVNPTPVLPETTPNPKFVGKIRGMTSRPTIQTTPEPIPMGPLRSLRMPARPRPRMAPEPTTSETKQIDIDMLRSLRMPTRPSLETTPEPTTPKEKSRDILRSLRMSVCPSQETTPEPTTPKPQPMVNGQLRSLRRPTRLSPETTPSQATQKSNTVDINELMSSGISKFSSSITTQNPTSPEQKQLISGKLGLLRMPTNKPQETTPNTAESEPLSVSKLRSLRRPVAPAAEMTTRLTSQTEQPTNPEPQTIIISGLQSTGKTVIPTTPQIKSVTCDCESSRTGSTSPVDTPAADDLLDQGDSGGSVSVTSFHFKGEVGHSDDQGLPLGKGVTKLIDLPKKKKDKDVPDNGQPLDFKGKNPNPQTTRFPGKVLPNEGELVDSEGENPIFGVKNTRFPGNVLPDKGELVDFEGKNPFLGEDGQPIDFGGSNSDDQPKEDGFLTDENGDAIDGGWMDAARNPIINTGKDTKSKTPLPRGP